MGLLRFFLFFLFMNQAFCSTDLVIFSYDRPMQLYALLESVEQNVQGIDRQVVIYRTSQKAYEKAYKTVRKRFFRVEFLLQDKKMPEKDFQPLVLSTVFGKESKAKYVVFATDDCIVTRLIDLNQACSLMEQYRAYAFYFRLGLNIDYCYMNNSYTGIPKGDDLGECFLWKLLEGVGDWGYENNVDFTLYRKRDIQPMLEKLVFHNPNMMESKWAKCTLPNKKGICFHQSCMINMPLNTVANAFNNRHMNWSSPAEMLHHFAYGNKIDIQPLQGMENRSPHVEVVPQFIPRQE